MRKVLVLAAVLLASTGGLAAAAPASASAASAARMKAASVTPDVTNTQLCAFNPELCMNGDDGNFNAGDGGLVKGFPLSAGDHQNLAIAPASNCGGTVTPNCPFTLGLGLNNLYGTDPIVIITNPANHDVYRAEDGDVVESPSGDGQLWVEDGSLANSDAVLINVAATDTAGSEEIACVQGSGQPLVMNAERNNPSLIIQKCIWIEHHS